MRTCINLQLRDSAGFSPIFPHYFERLFPAQTRLNLVDFWEFKPMQLHYTDFSIDCQNPLGSQQFQIQTREKAISC
jgi:hypothetical protein